MEFVSFKLEENVDRIAATFFKEYALQWTSFTHHLRVAGFSGLLPCFQSVTRFRVFYQWTALCSSEPPLEQIVPCSASSLEDANLVYYPQGLKFTFGLTC